jgi:copper chaperone
MTMDKVTLKVTGMSCMGCVSSVRQALATKAGVTAVDVSLERGEVTVSYDPDHVSLPELRAAITEAGYDVASPL